MIPFIDLNAQQKLIRDKINKRINQVLDHGQYILGPEVKELEDRLSSFTGSKYVLCCSSGTDALLLSLLGLKIKPGEGVIVPAFTFFGIFGCFCSGGFGVSVLIFSSFFSSTIVSSRGL